MFDGFMSAQREVIIRRDMIQAALKMPVWTQVAQSHPLPTIEQFASNLKVETRFRSEYLKIAYVDKDPVVAAAAVRSIVSAYQQTYEREHDRLESERQVELRDRQGRLTAELEELQAKLESGEEGNSITELDTLYAGAANRANRLRLALAEVQRAIAGAPSSVQAAVLKERSPHEMMAEIALRSAMDALVRAEGELAAARCLGYGPSHPLLIRLESSVVQCRNRLEECIRESNSLHSRQTPGASAPPLVEQEATLHRQIMNADREMENVESRRNQLAELGDQAATIKQNLKATNERLDALATEASLASRMTVVNAGDEPMTPTLDNRAKFATAGGLTGLALPVAFLIGVRTLRRRHRYGDEVAEHLSGRAPFVAPIPEVHVRSMINSDEAARCVHALRVRLQARKQEGSRVYLLTSTVAAEGTTSLTLSLALSATVAGLRTLVIDGNLNSRKLTLGFEAGSSPGMIDALSGGEPVVHRIRAGFSVLAAGQLQELELLKLRPESLDRMFRELRSRYDLILVDGEPILSSFLSSTIAPHVDGVCVILARGQKETLLGRAVEQIQSTNAPLSGILFNRAAKGDFPAMRKRVRAHDTTAELPTRLNRFGTLVTSVLASLSLSDPSDLDEIERELQSGVPKTKAA